MEKFYRNNLAELEFYHTIDDARAASINDAAWAIKNLIMDDKDYVDSEVLTKNSKQLIEAARTLISACQGKEITEFVSSK